MKKLQLLTVGLLWLLVLSGCSVISQDIRTKADPLLTFELVSPYPTQYAGEVVIWGGYIIENQTKPNPKRLVILQTPLSFNQAPKDRDTSQGRFIVAYDQFLDPKVYEPGRAVTVAGRVADYTEDLEDDEYGSYPVLQLMELHLWENRYRDRYYYDSYPYPYYYDRYYHRYHHPYHSGSSLHFLFGF